MLISLSSPLRRLGLAAALVLAPALAPAASFTDVTASAGLTSGGGSAGAGWADYDGDGCVDLFVSGMPNALYHNECDGTFTDVTVSAGVERPLDGQGVAWADYDGDGDLDLFVASRSASASNVLYQNQGDGSFVDVAPDAGIAETPEAIRAAGAAWGDYDGDGDLDLFVANRFGDPSFDQTDRLYRNEGDGTFTEVGAAAGVVGDSDRLTFMGAWVDLDLDGDLDLYVSVDFDDDVMYSNDGDGTFTDISASAGITDPQHGMGLALGDPNHDGLLDIASTNNHQGDTDPTHEPTVLYRNNGDGTYQDVTENAQLLDRDVVEWGVNFVDYDNDGDDDLSIVAGGMLSDGEPNILYENPGNGVFVDATVETGTENSGGSFGSAWADFDDDGDLDWFVANETGSNVLFRNDGPVGGHLRVALDGVLSNGFGIGARVEVMTAGDPHPQVRILQSGESYLSSEEPEAYFGLGGFDADSVQVIWPSGVIDEVGPAVAGESLLVTEGEAIVNGLFFSDRFLDGVLPADWIFGFGSWSEIDGRLVGTPGGGGVAATIATPGFAGCDVCTLSARVEASAGTGDPERMQIGMFGWFQNLANHALVILRPETDTLIFRQVEDGSTVVFLEEPVSLAQDVAHDLEVEFDGDDFHVRLDGALVVDVASGSAATPSGTFGFATRELELAVDEVVAYRID